MTTAARRRLMVAACAGMTTVAAACGQQEPAEAPVKAEAGRTEIACQPTGTAEFVICALERAKGPQGLILTVHEPDGGFRRLLVTRDGRGVVAADGAEPAVVSIIGDREIEVAIGGDRYRLPATVAANRPAAATKP